MIRFSSLEKGAVPSGQMQAQIAQFYAAVGDTAKATAADAKAKAMQKLEMDAMMKQFEAQQKQQPAPAK